MAGLKTTIVAATVLCSTLSVAALPPGTVQMDLTRVLNQSAYAVQMAIGTPPQTMSVIVDTGSPFMGLAGTKSNWCTLPKKPCAQYGSYNNLTSSTAKFVSNQFNNALINHGLGDYIADTVRTGGQTFPKVEFGMILNYAATFPAPDTITGLLGLVPFCNATTNSCAGPPITFQQRLVKRGFVKKNIVSVYLGPEQANAKGQLLFSAVDRAKQLGKPVTFPIIPVSDPSTNTSPNKIPYSSVSVSYNGTTGPTTKQFSISKNSNGIVDTGLPYWLVPTSAWKFVKQYFQITGDGSEGDHPVDCKYRQAQKDGATLHIGFANDKLKINIPMQRLVTQLAPGKCITRVSDCQTTGDFCGFGDPFLRSTYFSLDIEAQTITMSNVRYTTQTNIVAA